MSISVICDRHSVIDHSHQLNSYIFLITMQSLQNTHAHTHSLLGPTKVQAVEFFKMCLCLRFECSES